MYIGFLLGEPKHGSCCRLAEVMDISHDSATRFLQRERYDGKDLYDEAAPLLNLKGGVLSVDDSVLDKPYSQYLAFVGYFWSGKHHRTVKGINLITLYYTDVHGQHLPINFRVYDKSEGKTKNDYFQDMLDEVLAWGLEPAMVTGDKLVQWRGQPETDQKPSVGLALRAGKQPYGFPGKRSMGTSTKAGHPERRPGRLAQAIRSCEAVSDVVERPTTPLRRLPG
jgi:hypothetical protein